MALLTVQRVSKAGTADLISALTAAGAAGDTVPSSNGLLIVVDNGDASPHTLTIAAPVSSADTPRFGDLPVADLTLIVAAADTGLLTVPPGYANAAGQFAWTYDDVTSVTVGVFSLSP